MAQVGRGQAPEIGLASGGEFSVALEAAHDALLGPPPSREAASEWLDATAHSAAHDHLGGGFFEGAGANALFEKRLRTNALAVDVYSKAYQLTGALFFREVAEEAAAFLVRDLRGSDGRFWRAAVSTSQAAGRRFVSWTPEEIQRFLGSERAREFLGVYELEAGLLTLRGTPFAGLAPSRRILAFRRSRRPRPDVDTTFDATGNAAAAAALARLGSTLARGFALDAARRAGEGLAAAELLPEQEPHAAVAYLELIGVDVDGPWHVRARASVGRSIRERCAGQPGPGPERLSCAWQVPEADAQNADLALLQALGSLGALGDALHQRQATRLERALRDRARANAGLARRLTALCHQAPCGPLAHE